MLNIRTDTQGDKSVLMLDGRVDTITSPQLEEALEQVLPSAKELVLDFKNCEYISSAGLRTLLMAQKIMMRKGSMTVANVNETVMETFKVTKFDLILTIV